MNNLIKLSERQQEIINCNNDLILVIGSVYLVAEVNRKLFN
jgi:folylpolyglutamate synthase/dihydropteroate synthase